jgi:hypothetical protein
MGVNSRKNGHLAYTATWPDGLNAGAAPPGIEPGLCESLLALLILAMRPNPIPSNIIAIANAQGAEISRNASRPDMFGGIYFLEVEARGEWIAAKLLVGFSRLLAQFGRKPLEGIAE